MRKIILICLCAVSVWAQAQEVLPSKDTATTPQGPFSSKEDGWHFGVGGSFDLGSRLVFLSATRSDQTGEDLINLQMTNTVSLNFDARHMNQDSWGFLGSLVFDGSRKFDGLQVTGDPNSFLPESQSSAKIQISVLTGNAVYRWTQFYVPFGLNVSSVKYTKPDGYTGDLSVHGGVGFQYGLGYYFNESLVGEVWAQAASVQMKETTNGVVKDYGRGFLTSSHWTLKYIF